MSLPLKASQPEAGDRHTNSISSGSCMNWAVSSTRWCFHVCPRALALTTFPGRILVCPAAFKTQLKRDLVQGYFPGSR